MVKRKALRPNLRRFFDFITAKNEGDVVSEAEIMGAAKWEKSTLDTHRNKNALDPFLTPLGAGKFRVRRSGSSISQDDVGKAFTQIRPTELVLLPGTRLKGQDDDYELIAELGSGAVARVWRAKRILDGSVCALKIVSPRPDLLEPSTLDNVKHRFRREARHGKRITHPNIVAYRDAGDFQDHPFLVMELADSSLASTLSSGPLSALESIEVVECCASGLEYLHQQSCVHRDVKPPNILRFGDRFVLGDLGIVKWSDMNPAFTSAGTITKAAVQLGSWYYMAPEQRRQPHEATSASDIYALGISWYEMLTGTTLDPATVAAQAFTNPSSVDSMNSVIRKMLSYEQENRPTSAEALRAIADIREALAVSS